MRALCDHSSIPPAGHAAVAPHSACGTLLPKWGDEKRRGAFTVLPMLLVDGAKTERESFTPSVGPSVFGLDVFGGHSVSAIPPGIANSCSKSRLQTDDSHGFIIHYFLEAASHFRRCFDYVLIDRYACSYSD